MNLQVVPEFRVIDESSDWIVVDKPAPLIVHPTNDKPEPTLLGGLQQLLSFEIANGSCLGIVTRLDRETSGLVLIAKHTAAARDLGKIFEKREAEKRYLAIVNGWPVASDWISKQPICRAADVGYTDIWVRQIVSEAGKSCETRFTVLERFERDGKKYSLVEAAPKTGRMHQIRVHLAASGFPIVGDKVYSGNGSEYIEWIDSGWTEKMMGQLKMPRHALHAHRLSISLNSQSLSWTSDLPTDMQAFIKGQSVIIPDLLTLDRTD